MGVQRVHRGREIIGGDFFVFSLYVPGALSTGNGAVHFKALHTGFTVQALQGVLVTLHTTSTGGVGEIIQVRNVTDTLDLMDTPNRMAFTDTWSLLTSVPTSLLQNRAVGIGDVLAIDIDDVDTGSNAADLTVHFYCERTPGI